MPRIIQYKTVAKVSNYDMEFSDMFTNTITSASASAVDSANASATSTVMGTASVNGTKVRCQLKAGTNLEDYLCTFSAITTNSDVFQKTVMLRVRNDVE